MLNYGTVPGSQQQRLLAQLDTLGVAVPAAVAEARATLDNLSQAEADLFERWNEAKLLTGKLVVAARRSPAAVTKVITDGEYSRLAGPMTCLPDLEVFHRAKRDLARELHQVIIDHGDAIIETLKPLLDAAAARLQEAAGHLPVDNLTDAPAIIAVGGDAAHWHSVALTAQQRADQVLAAASALATLGYYSRAYPGVAAAISAPLRWLHLTVDTLALPNTHHAWWAVRNNVAIGLRTENETAAAAAELAAAHQSTAPQTPRFDLMVPSRGL